MASARTVRRWMIRLIAVLLVIIVCAAIALAVWAKTGVMKAEPGPLESVLTEPGVEVAEDADAMVLRPAEETDSSLGLVFYPGAKVDADAYAARLAGLAVDTGTTVVIVKPWLGLALFDPRGLTAFTGHVPEVETWMVGGHSMGGVRACSAASGAAALILFASYCGTDISDSEVPVLSLSGSADGLSTPQKIAENRDHLPASARMVEIPGASHASFGDYGPQSGDGTPNIDDEQMNTAVTGELTEFARSLTGG